MMDSAEGRTIDHDPRRLAEFETGLLHAAERLEARLQHLERVSAILVDIVATARSMIHAREPPQGLKGLTRAWPHIQEVVQRAHLLATQVTNSVNELYTIIGEPL